MNTHRIKLVADSSCDIMALDSVPYQAAPLRIITSEKEYVDDQSLDLLGMVSDLERYNGKSSTSCPNREDWLSAFGDSERVICFTITSSLSGSYNAACLAKKVYEQEYPDRKVFVVDSLSVGPETRLLIEKARELILADTEFEEVCAAVVEYSKKTGLVFMLESLKNLANNGRVSPIVAKAAGLLGIRLVGRASDGGELEPLEKCRGGQRALQALVLHMKNLGLRGGRLRISHCFNEDAALRLRDMLLAEIDSLQISISECRGLCSFYAEKGGLLIGFERA